jgi:hypothetical protein
LADSCGNNIQHSVSTNNLKFLKWRSDIELQYSFIKKRKKAKWNGHIWRRNCLLKHVTEGKIEGRIAVRG